MLFNDAGPVRPQAVLAISQPAHALVSGQILAAWAEPIDEAVVLAAAQHDVSWLDWEVAPEFDERTGRPRDFRTIGAAEHAPMWERGVERALAAWGRRVALMISRHGSTIYRRFADRHRAADGAGLADDERAALDYVERHRARQAAWAGSLGLDPGEVALDADRIAFADTLSLVLCGALAAPAPFQVGAHAIAISPLSGRPGAYGLDPWPLHADALTVEVEARPLPPSGRLADAAAMRGWLADPARRCITLQLARR